MAIWLILVGAMQGAGYTRWPMYATVLCLTVIRLPLAWLLTVEMQQGPIGTWFSIAITSVLVGCLMVWRFKSGVWKLQKV